MNDYRSPLWDKKLTLIGILLTVLITVFFTPIVYKKYSDVMAAKVDTNIKDTKPNFVPAELSMIDIIEEPEVNKSETYYLPSDVMQKKAEVEFQEWLDSESYLPSSVKEQKVKVEEAEAEKEEQVSNSGSYYGCLELTAYTWTGNPCADGVYPSSGYTVACNNSDLWHHWIYIEGYGNYYVHDTGGMGYGVIDIYMDSYDSCIQFGRRSANIYVID